MKLYINTSDNSKTVVGLGKDRLEKPTGPDKSQPVLTLIDQILKKNKKTLKDLTEIEVDLSPGSFTGLRVGVSVANTLGWALKIPVNGKRVDREGPVESVYKKYKI